MAEFSKNTKTAKDNLSKELNSMSDEVDRFDNQQDELIDDEDAIERLLMDNAFDSPIDDEEDEFAEIDELISERLENSNAQQDDEFADDMDDFIASVEATPVQTEDGAELDEFIEIDEFAEDESSESNSDIVAEHDPSDAFSDEGLQQADEEFLMTDFDISADDSSDEAELADETQKESVVIPEPVEKTDVKAAAKANDKIESVSALAAISAQLAELQSEQHIIRQQLETFEGKDATSGLVDELDALNSEQKKIQRRITSIEQNKPVFAYSALAVAIVALLVGGGLGIIGVSADTRVTELSETVVSLEEQVDAWMAKSKSRDGVQAVNSRLDRVDMEVANFSARLAAVSKKLEAFPEKKGIEQLWEQINQLSERNLQTATVLEALQQKVDNLESQKLAVAKTTPQKKAVIKPNWKVNLVSFKQEWYAKRKAAEFEKQGVPAEVMSVVIKGEPWYRLRVKDFNSKYEAAAYAAKVKKTLNLTSVWVTKD